MPARAHERLIGRNQQIDYDDLIHNHPWIVTKNQECILSPDSDGLLCGLFMSKYLNWKIKGFYDAKVLLVDQEADLDNIVYLDVEICRSNVKSIGHHMLLNNKRHIPQNWRNFNKCIQPNILRNYDKNSDFQFKYPFATIHLLLGILGHHTEVDIQKNAICPLLFTDGTYSNLFNYPENCMNWIKYLGGYEAGNTINALFRNDEYLVYELMEAMDAFFIKRNEITYGKERGDRIKISNTDGSPYNIESIGNNKYKIDPNARDRGIKFIKYLSELTRWEYNPDEWKWDNYKLIKFNKQNYKGNITITKYSEIMELNPVSWAITGGDQIEYTLPPNDASFGTVMVDRPLSLRQSLLG